MDKKVIVALGGYAGSGKDTTGAIIKLDFGFQPLAFADDMRAMLLVLNPLISGSMRLKEAVEQYGWDNAKRLFPEIRELLQRFGTEVGRAFFGEDVWTSRVVQKIAKGDALSGYVITDVRFPDELAVAKSLKAVTFWIERPGLGPVNGHSSERSVSPSDFDYTIVNDGSLIDLQDKVAFSVAAAIGVPTPAARAFVRS